MNSFEFRTSIQPTKTGFRIIYFVEYYESSLGSGEIIESEIVNVQTISEAKEIERECRNKFENQLEIYDALAIYCKGKATYTHVGAYLQAMIRYIKDYYADFTFLYDKLDYIYDIDFHEEFQEFTVKISDGELIPIVAKDLEMAKIWIEDVYMDNTGQDIIIEQNKQVLAVAKWYEGNNRTLSNDIEIIGDFGELGYYTNWEDVVNNK